MMKLVSDKVPKRWCLYWIPFQWLFTNLKKSYFVELKDVPKEKRKLETHQASLFSSKYEYLHVIKEVLDRLFNWMRQNAVFSADGISPPDGRPLGPWLGTVDEWMNYEPLWSSERHWQLTSNVNDESFGNKNSTENAKTQLILCRKIHKCRKSVKLAIISCTWLNSL